MEPIKVWIRKNFTEDGLSKALMNSFIFILIATVIVLLAFMVVECLKIGTMWLDSIVIAAIFLFLWYMGSNTD